MRHKMTFSLFSELKIKVYCWFTLEFPLCADTFQKLHINYVTYHCYHHQNKKNTNLISQNVKVKGQCNIFLNFCLLLLLGGQEINTVSRHAELRGQMNELPPDYSKVGGLPPAYDLGE